MKTNFKILSVMLIIVIVLHSFSVFAVNDYSNKINGGAPDLIVSSAYVSNPNFEVGDIVSIYGTVTNIGDGTAPQGNVALYNMVGCVNADDDKDTTYLHSQRTVDAGDTVDFALPKIKITASTISFDVTRACDGDTYESNNKLVHFEIESQKNYVDLSVQNVRVVPESFDAGDSVTLYADIKNVGGRDFAKANHSGTVNYGSGNVEFNTELELLGGEEKEYKICQFNAPSTEFNVSLSINQASGEAYTNNNQKEFTVKSYEVSKDYVLGKVGVTSGGFVTGGWVDNTLKKLYAYTDVGGFYVWNESLKEWNNLSTSIYEPDMQTLTVTGLQTIEGDANTFFVVMGDTNADKRGYIDVNKLYRTTDGGKTWQSICPYPITSEKLSSLIYLDPNNSNVLYLVTSYGTAYKTENALATVPEWEKINLPGVTLNYSGQTGMRGNTLKGLCSVIVDGSETLNGKSKRVYISSATDGIYMSVDGGETFTLMQNSPKYVLSMEVSSKGELYCASGVSYSPETSIDGDADVVKWDKNNWSTVFDMSEAQSEETTITFDTIGAVRVSPHSDNIIGISSWLSTGYNGYVHISTDGGESFKKIKRNTMEYDYPIGDLGSMWSSTPLFEFDPVNPKGIWRSLCKTDDFTIDEPEWTYYGNGFEELVQTQVMGVDEKDYVIGASMDGATVVKSGATLFDQMHVEKLGKTGDVGNESVTFDYCASNPDFIVSFGGRNMAYDNCIGVYTTDGGITDTIMSAESMPTKSDGSRDTIYNCAVSSDYNNGKPTIIAASNSKVYRTDDLGETWTEVDIDVSQGLGWSWGRNRTLCADPNNKGVFWAYDMVTGKVFVSNNDGVSFEESAVLPTSGKFMRALYGNENHFVIAMGIDGLMITADGGKTFTKANQLEYAKFAGTGAKAENSTYDTIFVYGSINGKWGIYKSENLGDSWVKMECDNTSAITNLRSIDGDKTRKDVVYLGTSGMGILMLMPKEADFTPINIVLNNADNETVTDSEYTLLGSCNRNVPIEIMVNGVSAGIAEFDSRYLEFKKNITLQPGKNEITVAASNGAGRVEKTLTVTDNSPKISYVKAEKQGADMVVKASNMSAGKGKVFIALYNQDMLKTVSVEDILSHERKSYTITPDNSITKIKIFMWSENTIIPICSYYDYLFN